MSADPLETRLRALTPVGGPSSEAVAFAAGAALAERRSRQRFRRGLVAGALAASLPWGAALWWPSPPAPPTVPATAGPPRRLEPLPAETPPGLAAYLACVERVGDEGLAGLGPVPVDIGPSVEPKPFNLEEFR